jgi:hypothetical protein
VNNIKRRGQQMPKKIIIIYGFIILYSAIILSLNCNHAKSKYCDCKECRKFHRGQTVEKSIGYLKFDGQVYRCVSYWMKQSFGNIEASCTTEDGREIYAYGAVTLIIKEEKVVIK